MVFRYANRPFVDTEMKVIITCISRHMNLNMNKYQMLFLSGKVTYTLRHGNHVYNDSRIFKSAECPNSQYTFVFNKFLRIRQFSLNKSNIYSKSTTLSNYS